MMVSDRETILDSAAQRERELEELFASYVERLNRGEELHPQEILARHPVLGGDLLACLEGYVEPDSAPRFAPSRTLGDYTLRCEIGRGGMGVVYDAWQNSLDRRVALKILPIGVAASDRAFDRFMREARTAAKLDHQNIVRIHGMGVESNTPYYSMEYVDGKTLAQIIASTESDLDAAAGTPFELKSDGSLDWSSIAQTLAEVADGLQHAHSRGVIHRDIKPSNLILDPEGRLRILDLGLARFEGDASLTLTGDVLGTLFYMSPEQARRRQIPVDHRTDIYSLGATLYEVLTRRPPFEGEDQREMISRIIEQDPQPLRRVNPAIPRDLETIVLKCLRKNARERYDTAKALAEDLRRFARGEPVEARPLRPWTGVPRKAWKHGPRIGVMIMVAALLVLLVSFLLPTAGLVTDDHAPGMSVRHVWELDPVQTVYPGGISRDGRFVSYVDWNYGNLAIRDLETGQNRMVTENDTTWASTGGWNEESVISPDGKRIAYHWNLETEGNYTLRVIDIDGSDLRVLHQDKDVPWARPFDWSPDGKSLLVDFSLGDMRVTSDVSRELALVSVDDGSVTVLSEWKGKRGPQMASFSPDGTYVAFDRSTSDTPIPRDIFVIDLSTGHEVAAVEHPANDMYLGWTPDGTRLLFTSDRTSKPSLWTIELSNGRPVGSPVLLKSDFAGAPVGFSTNGSYYYNLWTESRNVSIATLDESGTDFETVPEYASTRHVNANSSSDWSPDGQSLAYKMGPVDGSRRSVFGIYAVGTRQERIIKPSMHLNLSEHGRLGPVQWSADGRALYVSGTSVPYGRGMYRVDIATGDTRLIVQLQQPRNPQPTPDDKAVYYIRGHGSVIRHDLATGTEEEIHQSAEPMFGLDLSPDGKWLAFHQGRLSVVIMPAEGGDVREVVRLVESERSSERFATWTPDGKHLLFSKHNDELWRVNVETGEEQQIGSEIRGLFRATTHPDGKRIAYTTRLPSSELWVMENFLPPAPEQP